MASVAVLAGTVSTILFAVSTLPMLIKAGRTKELASYSRGNLVLANVGNAVHSIYVVQLPAGPIWALHTFYIVTSGLMLFWHLRYAKASPGQTASQPQPEIPMKIEHIETAIIGAGQAGLATAYHLQRRGRQCVILDRNQRVGDNWRTHWDSLRLYTPARYDGLPGLPFPASKWSYPTKDEVADYLAAYAERFALPVRTSTQVDRLEAADGRYALHLGDDRIIAENVVVATGTFGRTPCIPDFAMDIDPSIRQLHSSEYRRPAQLKPGSVLVVGASRSGTDIAYEVAAAHQTVLVGRDPGQMPVRLDHWSARLIFPVFVFLGRHVMTRRTPIGRKAKDETRFHELPMARVKRADLRARGVERVLDRVTGVRDGRPVLANDQVIDVANVVWCTGFRQVFDWIDLPIIGEDWPQEMRGVVQTAPGLFFCGLAFQYSFSSTVLPGVGRDAAYVAKQIDARAGRSFTLAA